MIEEERNVRVISLQLLSAALVAGLWIAVSPQ
jgi:hypothetical protein